MIFFEDLNLRSTLFAVGKDLLEPGNAVSVLRDLVQKGHEVGNHSMSHRYDLTILPTSVQAEEVDKATDVITRCLGVPPRGFRAPGYNVNQQLIGLLEERNYCYDSSVFPCPLYYAAKVQNTLGHDTNASSLSYYYS